MGEFVNGYNQYAYIPGECVADLPLGEVFVEICRGYEVRPLRTRVTVTPQTDELTFELERVLQWRSPDAGVTIGERGESRWDSGTTSADCERKTLFRESGSAST